MAVVGRMISDHEKDMQFGELLVKIEELANEAAVLSESEPWEVLAQITLIVKGENDG